jgi:hypothetical protein
VRKGNRELVGRLNQALRQILSDGTYSEIRKQYFDYGIYGGGASVADSGSGADQNPGSDADQPNGR